ARPGGAGWRGWAPRASPGCAGRRRRGAARPPSPPGGGGGRVGGGRGGGGGGGGPRRALRRRRVGGGGGGGDGGGAGSHVTCKLIVTCRIVNRASPRLYWRRAQALRSAVPGREVARGGGRPLDPPHRAGSLARDAALPGLAGRPARHRPQYPLRSAQ